MHKPPTDFTLWGTHPAYAGGAEIRVEGGTMRTCKSELNQRRRDGGWTKLVIIAACERLHGLPYGHPDHVCNAVPGA